MTICVSRRALPFHELRYQTAAWASLTRRRPRKKFSLKSASVIRALDQAEAVTLKSLAWPGSDFLLMLRIQAKANNAQSNRPQEVYVDNIQERVPASGIPRKLYRMRICRSTGNHVVRQKHMVTWAICGLMVKNGWEQEQQDKQAPASSDVVLAFLQVVQLVSCPQPPASKAKLQQGTSFQEL